MVLPAERETYFAEVLVKTWGLIDNVARVPPHRVAQLEDILFEKIRQRTHGADDEGKTAKRIFKHFDLDGFGTVEMKEFACALETLGCVFPQHEMAALFCKIDRNGSGKLDYEEFSAWFAHRGSGNNPNVNPVFGMQREVPHQVIDKVKAKVAARPGYAMATFRHIFNKMDKNGDARLDRHEVQWGLREDGHVLSPSEFERLFKYFDRNNDGVVDINEFFDALCPALPAEVSAAVDELYAKHTKCNCNMDCCKDCSGVCTKCSCCKNTCTASCCSPGGNCCQGKVCLNRMAAAADWSLNGDVKAGKISTAQAKQAWINAVCPKCCCATKAELAAFFRAQQYQWGKMSPAEVAKMMLNFF